MQNNTKLALMCKSHNYKVDPYSNEYRVGYWVIGSKRQDELIGAGVILTESKKSPAYLGGTIVGFVPNNNGKCEVIFKEDASMLGNQDAVNHNGWGLKRSVCYI